MAPPRALSLGHGEGALGTALAYGQRGLDVYHASMGVYPPVCVPAYIGHRLIEPWMSGSSLTPQVSMVAIAKLGLSGLPADPAIRLEFVAFKGILQTGGRCSAKPVRGSG